MKKMMLVIVNVLIAAWLFAATVPQATIFQVAKYWIEFQTGIPHTVENFQALPDSINPSLYKIDYIPNGFVVISADDSCVPILGYCHHGDLVPNRQNEALDDLILEYIVQVDDAKTNNRSNAETLPIWNALINQTISITEEHDIGLETPQWGGGASNNTYCPWDNYNLHEEDGVELYKRSVVGCVASAVAQILNYYKCWNYTLVPSDRYESNKNGLLTRIPADSLNREFPGFYTLNGYMDEVVYKYNNNIALTDNDKAALSFACGILVHMSYSSFGSGASGGSAVYTKMNMYYQYAFADSCASEEWIDLISKQLRCNRPIEYRGQNDEGGCHAFIICGFQSTNMNTTLNLVNWGRHWCFPEYWSLQPTNPASPYLNSHSMYYGIAPNASVNQTILLENGSTDYSGISLCAIGHDGISTTLTTDDGVFDFGLPPGTYDFIITDESSYFRTIQICDISIQMGTNHISPDPIVLLLKPTLVTVPTDVPTIQEAIDLVRNGCTVVIRNGNYIVSGLHWQGKHIKLHGQSQNGVFLTNNINEGLPAIKLAGTDIDNQDIISNITFLNCDLTRTGNRRGSAIELGVGAAPIVTNCTFNNNRVGNSGTSDLLSSVGVGGAVFVGGRRSLQVNKPRFVNCTFTNNFTMDGNGGGAIALYGQAQFTGCEFTNNKATITDETEISISNDMGGAVIVYNTQQTGDIDFDNCLFNNNKGRSEADDVFVANVDRLTSLRINGCTFTADTPYLIRAKPAIKFLNDSETYSESMETHLILTNNKFLSCRKGAVYFCDYYGKNRLTFTGNVVANNRYEGYGFYSWYPDASSPVNPEYFVFSNNTFSNITGSGLILFQSPSATVNNTVFENCSTNGIGWGDYEDGHPDWVTRGLTLNNCLFSSSSPRYDFNGSTSNPLAENSVTSVQAMQLDSNYKPIWISTTMSPCIDTGIGENDLDNSPADIGACSADSHNYWEYSFENQADHERWYWVSYPVLNTRTDGMLPASEYFQELLELGDDSYGNPAPIYLDEITWVVGEDAEIKSILWSQSLNNWTPYQYSHSVSSPQGYKIKLLTTSPNTVTLKESGFKTPETFQFPIHEEVENWLGYFKEGTQSPQDAFSSIWNDIQLIKAKNWSIYRDPSTGQLTGKQGKLNYGDMVIVVTNNYHTFHWGNNNVIPPDIKKIPKNFVFDEKPDYIPVYVSLPDSLMTNIKEIGLYVDGVCKGAVVVEDNIEQISAYVDSANELSQGNVEYVFSYEDSKGQESALASISLNPSRLQAKYGIAGNKYPYFEVKFTTNDVENIVPMEYTLGQNYPNPFNPSTTLSYSLPQAAKVRLDIYNLKGQLVKTLVNTHQEAGQHNAVWNGKDMNNRNVASGVYLYRLSNPNKTITKRMLLVK